jgi:hypothetical protein
VISAFADTAQQVDSGGWLYFAKWPDGPDHPILLGFPELYANRVEGERIHGIDVYLSKIVVAIAQKSPIEQLGDSTAIEVGVGSLQRFRNQEFVNRAHVNILQRITKVWLAL